MMISSSMLAYSRSPSDMHLFAFIVFMMLPFTILLCSKKKAVKKVVPGAVAVAPTTNAQKQPEKVSEKKAPIDDKVPKASPDKEKTAESADPKKEESKVEKEEKKIKTPPPAGSIEAFTSTARRRKREESMKQKLNTGFYIPESAQDDTLEKLKSLEEEKTEDDGKSVSKKKMADGEK